VQQRRQTALWQHHQQRSWGGGVLQYGHHDQLCQLHQCNGWPQISRAWAAVFGHQALAEPLLLAAAASTAVVAVTTLEGVLPAVQVASGTSVAYPVHMPAVQGAAAADSTPVKCCGRRTCTGQALAAPLLLAAAAPTATRAAHVTWYGTTSIYPYKPLLAPCMHAGHQLSHSGSQSL
jgi:hypothetical protein